MMIQDGIILFYCQIHAALLENADRTAWMFAHSDLSSIEASLAKVMTESGEDVNNILHL